MGKHNKHIELNPATISSDHTNLYSNYITSIPDTNYTLSTIQWTSKRGKNTDLAIKGIAPTEGSASTN